MKYEKRYLPFVEGLIKDKKAPKIGVLGRVMLRGQETPSSRELVTREAFAALGNLVKTFGSDDEKGIWIETAEQSKSPKAFIRPTSPAACVTYPGKQIITFHDARRNSLTVAETEDSSPDVPKFVLVDERAPRSNNLIDFNELPLPQRAETLTALEILATAMTAEEKQPAYTATPGWF